MQSKKETVAAWAEITVEKWKKNIGTLKIGSKGELLQSFKTHIEEAAGGDIHKVKFAYLYYGKFVDLGVGKGKKLRTAAALKGKKRGKDGRFTSGRKAKIWYSKTVYIETIILSQLMADYYGSKGVAIVKDNIAAQITVDF